MGLTQAHHRNNYYFGEFQHIAIERTPEGTFRAFINGKLLMRGNGPWKTEEEAFYQAARCLYKDIKHAYEIEFAEEPKYRRGIGG